MRIIKKSLYVRGTFNSVKWSLSLEENKHLNLNLPHSVTFVDGNRVSYVYDAPSYRYYLRNHQGNNRVLVDQSETVSQVNHYYPFGGCSVRASRPPSTGAGTTVRSLIGSTASTCATTGLGTATPP